MKLKWIEWATVSLELVSVSEKDTSSLRYQPNNHYCLQEPLLSHSEPTWMSRWPNGYCPALWNLVIFRIFWGSIFSQPWSIYSILKFWITPGSRIASQVHICHSDPYVSHSEFTWAYSWSILTSSEIVTVSRSHYFPITHCSYRDRRDDYR